MRHGTSWWTRCAFLFVTLVLSACAFPTFPSETTAPLYVDPSEKTTVEKRKEEPSILGEGNSILLVTGEYLPYTSEDLPDGGFFTQRVRDVFAEMGMDAEIRFYPWRRCEAMVQAGEAWASFPYGDSESNRERFLLSDPLYTAVHRYFYRKENANFAEEASRFTTLDQFKNHVFGGTNGYWYGTKEELTADGWTVEWAADALGLLSMLEKGRIDFMIDDEKVGWEMVERSFPGEKDRFGTLPQEAARRDYLLLVSRRYPDAEVLLKQFNAANRKLSEGKRDGVIPP